MKRQKFRLGSVLRYYELQKQRAEQDLHHASEALRAIDGEIARLESEVVALAEMVDPESLPAMSTAGWIACGRRSEYLGRCIQDARRRRVQQMEVVTRCAEQRKRWAIAEEMLLTMRRKVDNANQAEEAKALQVDLQESMLRRWLRDDSSEVPVT